MAYRVKINGFDVQCDSPAELLTLTLRANEARGARPSAATQNRHGDGSPKGHVQRSHALLSTVQGADPEGLSGAELARAIGCNPSALAVYRVQMEHVLKSYDLKFADVVEQVRVNDVRRWRKGPKIGEAIKALKDEMK
jgi:hypothetical protein